MKKIYTQSILMLVVLFLTGFAAQAQNTVITGTVTDQQTNELIVGASVTVKGKAIGTTTDANGKFTLSTSEPVPFTVMVSYVGYTSVERQVSGSTNLTLTLSSAVVLGQEVVISASRTPERILESPVSIERMGVSAIREVATPSFYDALTNLKGIESSNQSLTFKSINARGFNSNGNTRFNQFIDGMDNQAPGLNFSVGNIVGITELDIDNVELLPGASSALYGAGGINGTMLMTSKDPFKYPGASFQFKTGLNHFNDNNSGVKPFNQLDVRLAKSWNDKFAFKVAFSFLEAKDWQADNFSNFDRVAQSVKPGTRATDPGYDGVNVYGDEVNSNLQGAARSIQSAFNAAPGGAAAIGAFNSFIAGGATYSQIVSLVNANPAYAALRPALPYLGVVYGLNKGLVPSQTVSRTGYNESDLVDYDTKSLKTSTSLHYKFNNTIQLVAQANWGTGTTVYTGSDRYSIRNFNIGQYKLELKGDDFFLKAYTTQERSGDSYISSVLGSYINETTSPTATSWFPTYTLTYAGARGQGLSDEAAHAAARAAADANRAQPGTPAFEALKRKIINTNISSTNVNAANPAASVYGAKFDDKTNLYHYEGMYNFSSLFNNVVELQMGASERLYQLRSGGTIFDDLNREINIHEFGAFAQLGKKFGEKFKLTVAGRYDKSSNFDGRFTPRVTGVYSITKNNNIRVSYQTGYRNPTTQNQYIDLSVGGGVQRLIGGLPESITKYALYANKGYTESSYRNYLNSAYAGAPNPALLQQYTFDFEGVKPESVQAFEAGYKGLITPSLLIDVYGYYNIYEDFITAVNVYQLNGGAFTKFGVPVNAEGKVKTYGGALGLDYLVGKYNLSGNVSYNQIGDLPVNYINDFNTPKVRFNIGVGNREIRKNLGFNINYRWQDAFYWNSSFAAGTVPAFGTLDAQVNLKIPSVNSMLKLGGSNLLNKYYMTSFGNPESGAMYYLGLTFNP